VKGVYDMKFSTVLILVAVLVFSAMVDAKEAKPKSPVLKGIEVDVNSVILDVNTIVNKANIAAYYQGKDGKAKVRMTITSKQGKKSLREFIILRKDVKDGGDQKYYVYFHKPADVRKMVFIVHKHTDIKKDDDRWLYLPALDLVRRIAAGDKRTSFVGSDFLYEDVSGRSLDEDTHELTETTDKLYVIKNVPKKAETVEFSYYKVSIDRKTFVPMKMEFFDKAGQQNTDGVQRGQIRHQAG